MIPFYNKINNKVIKLWNDNKDFLNNYDIENNPLLRAPLLYPKNFERNSVLFIGLNPSFSPKGMKKVIKDNNLTGISDDYENFFSLINLKNNKKYIKDFELSARYKNKHSYFHRFDKIIDYLNNNHKNIYSWEHIDLFFIRETYQKNIKKVVFEKKEHLIPFASKQVDLTLEIIKDIKPLIIIITSVMSTLK